MIELAKTRKSGDKQQKPRDRGRRKPEEEPEAEEFEAPREPPPVTEGTVGGKIVDVVVNATREKLREFTIIDRMQGRIFPILDMMNTLASNCIQIATFRQDKRAYQRAYARRRPELLDNILDEYLYRVAQWQRSVQGKALDKMWDVVLAETEVRANDEEEPGEPSDEWK